MEWLDQFEKAAAANRWTDPQRKLQLVKGFLREAAADWVTEATNADATNTIIYWNRDNAADTSFVPRFTKRFASETRQLKWYYELMSIRQTAEESVDAFAMRFRRLLRKVNTNELIPDLLQV